MAFAQRVGGLWQEIVGPFSVGDIQYPANWPELASADELQAAGLFEVEEAGPVPANCQVLGQLLAGDDTPRREWITEPWSIEQRRVARKTAAAAIRQSIEDGLCQTPLGIIQTPEKSRINILGLVAQAERARAGGAPFSQPFRMADNSMMPHNAVEMIALGDAVADRMKACAAAYFVIADAVNASDEPESVDIATGWPAGAI